MIGYITVGTNDWDRALAFYDALLNEFDATRSMETDSFVAWSAPSGSTAFVLHKTANGLPATYGNGTMIALAARDKEQVDAVYRRALELGAIDEGAAGPRGEGFYAGYFRDQDGNKLNAFFMG